MRYELSNVGSIVLRGTRIIVPSALREHFAHEGHQGIVKTKQRLRSKVWWPGLDKETDRSCKSCHACQLVGQNSNPEPLRITDMPQSPWSDLAADLFGPMLSNDLLVCCCRLL